MPSLFEWLDDITLHKKDLTRGDDEDGAINSYDPFIINMGLSQHVDTILYANELNKHPGVSKQMHHDYLLHSIRARRRTGKWAKRTKYEDLDIVMEYFGFSQAKAVEALNILTEDQLKSIKESLNTGGKKK